MNYKCKTDINELQQRSAIRNDVWNRRRKHVVDRCARRRVLSCTYSMPSSNNIYRTSINYLFNTILLYIPVIPTDGCVQKRRTQFCGKIKNKTNTGIIMPNYIFIIIKITLVRLTLYIFDNIIRVKKIKNKLIMNKCLLPFTYLAMTSCTLFITRNSFANKILCK
jgi:hypothetical protein